MGQPHHPLATAWFNSHQGFTNNRYVWGIKFKPVEILPDPWNFDIPGIYFVDPTHPNSTFNDVTGNPARPRKRFPIGVAPGSIIYAAGGPYTNKAWTFQGDGIFKMGGAGELANPVYVRGDYGGSKVRLHWPLQIEGTYVVAQGFEVVRDALPDVQNTGGIVLPGQGSNHLVVRDCEVTGPQAVGHTLPGRSGISVLGTATQYASDVIIYKCKVHDFGNWQNTGDRDQHGVGVGQFSRDVTILNCEMWHCEGNGVQINVGYKTDPPEWIERVFVYRNEAYANKQSGFWTKTATDIRFVQNIARNTAVFQTGSSYPSDPWGAGLGLQYRPQSVWFIANTVHTCETGIMLDSGGNEDGSDHAIDVRIEDNDISLIEQNPIDPNPPGFLFSNGWAIKKRDGPTFPLISANKIYDCDGGIAVPGGAAHTIDARSNTFWNIESCHFVFEGLNSKCGSTICGNEVLPPGTPLCIQPTQACAPPWPCP